MKRAIVRRSIAVAAASCAAFVAAQARASNVTEFPDNGSEQMGRGGAWVARASDPLAGFYNPAGLAGQETRLIVNANITFQHTCFTRMLAQNDTTQEPLVDPANGQSQFPRVCNDIKPFLNPQVAFTYRASERVGIGFIPILAPSSVGSAQWPEFTDGRKQSAPAPNRYLLLAQNGVLLTPTIAVGWEALNGLRIGASFQWGIAAKLHFENASAAVNGDNANPAATDVKGEVDVSQAFIPGFTVGALWSISDDIDLAGWYKWSAPVNAKGDVKTSSNYFTPEVANGNTGRVKTTDSSQSDCGLGAAGGATCGSGNNASLRLPVPMEAKLGLRYHMPLRGGEIECRRVPGSFEPVCTKHGQDASHLRDPMSQDLFDAEVDLTWANNSAIDTIQVRFPGDAAGTGKIPVNGIPGGVIPPNADQIRNYKDVFGVRVGGDLNVLPGRLALRAGAFFETKAQDDQFQSIDFPGGQRFGLALGGTYRIKLGQESSRAIEVSLGYGHVFFGSQTNNQVNGVGVPALAGGPCNPPSSPVQGDTCSASGAQRYRTNWPVNLGTITSAINVINVGVGYRF